jgi:hypothetical protein
MTAFLPNAAKRFNLERYANKWPLVDAIAR